MGAGMTLAAVLCGGTRTRGRIVYSAFTVLASALPLIGLPLPYHLPSAILLFCFFE